MTEISERYARLGDAFGAKIAAVPDRSLVGTDAVRGVDRADLVAHVVDAQGMFLGFVGESLGDIPAVDDDPLGAWNAAPAPSCRTISKIRSVPRAEFEGLMGKQTFEGAVDRFLSFDLVVHGWDLAHATGLDDRIAPEDVERTQSQAEAFGDAMRSPRAFGPALEPPAGADAQARLLAFLGRRP